MSLYDSLFHMMDMQAAQVLVTSKEFSDPVFRENLSITVEDLLAANVVPVFNENDAISSRPQNDVSLVNGFLSPASVNRQSVNSHIRYRRACP